MRKRKINPRECESYRKGYCCSNHRCKKDCKQIFTCGNRLRCHVKIGSNTQCIMFIGNPITQEESLDVLRLTPYPRRGSDIRFVQRFMLRLNNLAKKRGYRLFGWTEYMIQDEQVIGSWILSNIEPLSREIIKKKKNY